MIEPRASFVDANNIRLHYLEWDPQHLCQTQQWTAAEAAMAEEGDNIPLVMLHALGATAHSWRLVADHLCRQYPVIAFDLRGHGQSDQPESGYELATMAEDVISGMANLGLGQVALVGHGWGARVALVLAARHPALVSHLILVDCPHVEPKHWPGMTRERFIREREGNALYDSREAFLQAMHAEMATFWSPEIEQILLTYIRELPDGRVEERLRPAQQVQIRASLWDDRALSYYSRLTCPVLLVPAAAEPAPDGELPERLESAGEFAAAKGYMAVQVARVIQRCSVLWMPDTAHDIQFHRPHLLAQAIARFVQENA